MATVTHETQRSNDARHPRGDRTRRAALCAPERARHAQGLSLRQAAKALDVPRSTLQAWRASPAWRDEPPAVVAFVPRAPGLACVHRLVRGIPLGGPDVGAWGLRLGCLLGPRTGLDRLVAASAGAQPQVNGQVEEAIVASRREESARVAHARPAHALPGAKEAPVPGGRCRGAMAPQSHAILGEPAAPARAQDTGPALREQALAGLPGQRRPSPREEAPGLLA